MPNYSKSKIYKIVCNITGETYYGSTTQALSSRLAGHKNDLKRKTKGCSSKQILERENYNIILCEEVCCDNKEQLKAIERKYIEENECVNKNIPLRTKKEYNSMYDKTEKAKEMHRKYQHEHRQTEEGKKAHRDYERKYRQNRTEEQKENYRKYRQQYMQTDKAKELKREASKKYREKQKLLKVSETV